VFIDGKDRYNMLIIEDLDGVPVYPSLREKDLG